jgi:nucleoside transporter
MMFLQYFGMGAWVVPLSRYLAAPPADGGLGFGPEYVGLIYATMPIAGMLSPLVIGPLADRYFAAEKLLGVFELASAALLLGAGCWSTALGDVYARKAAAGIATDSMDDLARVGPLFALMLGYAFVFMPTLPLATVIALRNLDRPAETFGRVRLVGTFGWIVSGYVISLFLDPVSPQPLFLAAGTAAALGVAAFFLPHTPPKGRGRPIGDIIGLPALKMFADRAFVAFAAAALLVNMVNQFYTLFTTRFLHESGVGKPESVMTLAQWFEMGCMAVFPWLVRRFGLKTVMLAGLIGWGVRTAAFMTGSVPLMIAVAVPLHGVGYVLFTIVAAIFVDREAPPHLRAGAQSLVAFLGSGPAALAGNWLGGRIGDAYRSDWPMIWLVPSLGCGLAALVFLALFREPRIENRQAL